MPIYEFKCLKCDEFVELIVMNQQDKVEIKCSKCDSPDLERVLSVASHSIKGGAAAAKQSASSQTRSCSGGSCTTYTVPGPG